MTRLRILFFHSVPFSPISGENLRGRALLAELSRRGHAVDVVSPASSGVHDLQRRSHLQLTGVDRFRRGRILQHLAFGALARVRGIPRRRHDLVYCFGLAGTPAAVAAAARHRSPLVIDLYEVDYPTLRPEAGALAQAVLAAADRWLVRALRRSTSALALSAPLAEMARHRGAPSVNVFHDFAEERFLPGRRPSTPAPVIGFHGGIYERDGLDLLVTAAARLATVRSFTIRIHGRGPALGAVSTTARRCGFPEERLDLAGWVPHTSLPDAVACFSFAVVPMRRMPVNDLVVPRKLFEYMRMGIPFVTADLPTVRAFFSEDEAVFYRCEDVSDLAQKIETLLDDPRRVREISRRLLERGGSCSLEAECSKIADHLEEVARIASGTRDDTG